jgi:hypothetical protein
LLLICFTGLGRFRRFGGRRDGRFRGRFNRNLTGRVFLVQIGEFQDMLLKLLRGRVPRVYDENPANLGKCVVVLPLPDVIVCVLEVLVLEPLECRLPVGPVVLRRRLRFGDWLSFVRVSART